MLLGHFICALILERPRRNELKVLELQFVLWVLLWRDRSVLGVMVQFCKLWFSFQLVGFSRQLVPSQGRPHVPSEPPERPWGIVVRGN